MIVTLLATLKNYWLSPKYSHLFYTRNIQAYRKLMRKNDSVLTGFSACIWVLNSTRWLCGIHSKCCTGLCLDVLQRHSSWRSFGAEFKTVQTKAFHWYWWWIWANKSCTEQRHCHPPAPLYSCATINTQSTICHGVILNFNLHFVEYWIFQYPFFPSFLFSAAQI